MALTIPPSLQSFLFAAEEAGNQNNFKMKLGLVTYLWGQDWDLPSLLMNCEKAKILGVELRTNPKDRIAAMIEQREVWQKMIADSAL